VLLVFTDKNTMCKKVIPTQSVITKKYSLQNSDDQ